MARTTSLEGVVFASEGDRVNPDDDTRSVADQLTMAGGNIDAQGPFSTHFNYIDHRQDAMINLIEQQGILEWSSLTSYTEGALCKVERQIYQLSESGDGSSDPSTDGGVNWIALAFGDASNVFVTATGSDVSYTLGDVSRDAVKSYSSMPSSAADGERAFDQSDDGLLKGWNGASWENVEADFKLPAPQYAALSSRLMSDVANGLEITPFNFGASEPNGVTDNHQALQDAFEFVLGNFRTTGLNLAGRSWSLGQTIDIDFAPQAQRRIHNGRISALSSFSGGYMLSIDPAGSDVAGNRTAFKMDNVTFSGGGTSAGSEYAEGAITIGKAQGVLLDRIHCQFFSGAMINSTVDRAAVELMITNCYMTGRGTDAVGIRALGYDSEYRGNIILNCKDGAYFTRSGNNLQGNHIYGCSNSAATFLQSPTLLENNYIDNCPIITGSLQNTSITGNKFLCTVSDVLADSSFIIYRPTDSREVRAASIIGNHFNNNTGATIDSLIFDGTSGGSHTFFRNFSMYGNGFRNTTPRYSHPRAVSSTVSAGTSTTVDFSTLVPFGEVKSASAAWRQSSGSTVVPAIATKLPASGNLVEVNLSTAATGVAEVKASVNSDFSDI